MSLLLIAIFTNSVFPCLSDCRANGAREMRHSVLLLFQGLRTKQKFSGLGLALSVKINYVPKKISNGLQTNLRP